MLLLPFSCGVALASWEVVYAQPNDLAEHGRTADWGPTMKYANDRVFDMKVEAGIVPAPVS